MVERRANAPYFPVTFVMAREADQSGVSGTGVVLEGVLFHDDTIAVRWVGDVRSTVVYTSLKDFLAIHVIPHPENDTLVEFSTGDTISQEDAEKGRY
jgi:hypothetical protein